MAVMIPRPAPTEYGAFYAGYIQGVPDGDLLVFLRAQMRDTRAFLESIPGSKGDFAYAQGKWSVKEVVGHVSDTERVMSYRALRIARGDETPLPGFDENAFARVSGAARRTVTDLSGEFAHVRQATLDLLTNLDADAFARLGTASGHAISVRALAYIIAGHEVHHLRVLRERYLAA